MPHRAENFSIHRGEDADLVITNVTSDGDALDLTGCTLTWELRVHPADATPIVTKSSNNASEILNTSPLTSACIVHLNANEIALGTSPETYGLIPLGVYDYRLTVEDQLDEVSRLLHGFLTVTP